MADFDLFLTGQKQGRYSMKPVSFLFFFFGDGWGSKFLVPDYLVLWAFTNELSHKLPQSLVRCSGVVGRLLQQRVATAG